MWMFLICLSGRAYGFGVGSLGQPNTLGRSCFAAQGSARAELGRAGNDLKAGVRGRRIITSSTGISTMLGP